jgi:hypothetical protein
VTPHGKAGGPHPFGWGPPAASCHRVVGWATNCKVAAAECSNNCANNRLDAEGHCDGRPLDGGQRGFASHLQAGRR